MPRRWQGTTPSLTGRSDCGAEGRVQRARSTWRCSSRPPPAPPPNHGRGRHARPPKASSLVLSRDGIAQNDKGWRRRATRRQVPPWAVYWARAHSRARHFHTAAIALWALLNRDFMPTGVSRCAAAVSRTEAEGAPSTGLVTLGEAKPVGELRPARTGGPSGICREGPRWWTRGRRSSLSRVVAARGPAPLVAHAMCCFEHVLPRRLVGWYVLGSLALEASWTQRRDIDLMVGADQRLVSTELRLLGLGVDGSPASWAPGIVPTPRPLVPRRCASEKRVQR